jgi:hypothetical protein
VSGPAGHSPAAWSIERTDDVVIGTAVVTISMAVHEKPGRCSPSLAAQEAFRHLDEAHHAPAPSFRKLLQFLKAQQALRRSVSPLPPLWPQR